MATVQKRCMWVCTSLKLPMMTSLTLSALCVTNWTVFNQGHRPVTRFFTRRYWLVSSPGPSTTLQAPRWHHCACPQPPSPTLEETVMMVALWGPTCQGLGGVGAQGFRALHKSLIRSVLRHLAFYSGLSILWSGAGVKDDNGTAGASGNEILLLPEEWSGGTPTFRTSPGGCASTRQLAPLSLLQKEEGPLLQQPATGRPSDRSSCSARARCIRAGSLGSSTDYETDVAPVWPPGVVCVGRGQWVRGAGGWSIRARLQPPAPIYGHSPSPRIHATSTAPVDLHGLSLQRSHPTYSPSSTSSFNPTIVGELEEGQTPVNKALIFCSHRHLILSRLKKLGVKQLAG